MMRAKTQLVRMHDGPMIKLKKLDRAYDPTNKWRALELLEASRERGEFVTGLLYINEKRDTLPETLHLSQTPLAHFSAEELRPSRENFAKLMAELM